MKWPSRVKELNEWIHQNYRVFESNRAYEEFDIDFILSGGTITHMVRVIHASLAIRGREGPCVREIAKALYVVTPLTHFLDRQEMLFFRTDFEYSDGCVYGRLAFWRPERQQQLLKYYFIKKEGMPAVDLEVADES